MTSMEASVRVVRYCPLCPWEYEEPEPQVLEVDRRDSLGETARAAWARHCAETEAALREHLTESHTAPIVLSAGTP